MTKRLIAPFVLLCVLALIWLLSHGVPLPRFVWEPQLAALSQQFPGIEVSAKRVVLAISARPSVMVSELQVQHVGFRENLQIALFRSEFSLLDSLNTGRLQLDGLRIKGLELRATKQGNCLEVDLACLPKLPLGLLAVALETNRSKDAGFFTPAVVPGQITIEQALFTVQNPVAGETLEGRIDRFNFSLPKGQGLGDLELAYRLRAEAPQANRRDRAELAARAKTRLHADYPGLALLDLSIDASANWAGFPWTAHAAHDALVLSPAVTSADGAGGPPTLRVETSNFRSYVRRDDAPETHQAAFSARHAFGGLPGQNWHLTEAEWTFTHEDANAWTFNAHWDRQRELISIEPARIAGSEGIPAQRQERVLNCEPGGVAATKPYWLWRDGWFRVVGNYTEELSAPLALCPLGVGR